MNSTSYTSFKQNHIETNDSKVEKNKSYLVRSIDNIISSIEDLNEQISRKKSPYQHSQESMTLSPVALDEDISNRFMTNFNITKSKKDLKEHLMKEINGCSKERVNSYSIILNQLKENVVVNTVKKRKRKQYIAHSGTFTHANHNFNSAFPKVKAIPVIQTERGERRELEEKKESTRLGNIKENSITINKAIVRSSNPKARSKSKIKLQEQQKQKQKEKEEINVESRKQKEIENAKAKRIEAEAIKERETNAKILNTKPASIVNSNEGISSNEQNKQSMQNDSNAYTINPTIQNTANRHIIQNKQSDYPKKQSIQNNPIVYTHKQPFRNEQISRNEETTYTNQKTHPIQNNLITYTKQHTTTKENTIQNEHTIPNKHNDYFDIHTTESNHTIQYEPITYPNKISSQKEQNEPITYSHNQITENKTNNNERTSNEKDKKEPSIFTPTTKYSNDPLNNALTSRNQRKSSSSLDIIEGNMNREKSYRNSDKAYQDNNNYKETNNTDNILAVSRDFNTESIKHIKAKNPKIKTNHVTTISLNSIHGNSKDFYSDTDKNKDLGMGCKCNVGLCNII